MARVTTPEKGFSGVVAGVTFSDGAGETDDPTALNYFRRHGYGIGSKPPVVPSAGDDQGDSQGDGGPDATDEGEKSSTKDKAPAKKAAPKKKSIKKAAAKPAAKK